MKTAGQNLWVRYLTYFENKNIANNFPDTILVYDSENGIIIDLNGAMKTSDQTINKAIEIRDILGTQTLSYTS